MNLLIKYVKKLKNTKLYNFFRIYLYTYIDLKESISFTKKKLLWREKNKHNYTYLTNANNPCNYHLEKIKVGRFTYGPINAIFFGNMNEFLEIGDFCSIADGVKFVLGGEHSFKTLSTYPFRRYLIDKTYSQAITKGPIIVEDDVWIGTDALILSGIKLSKGTVVAAGSVVTKSTEPYSIIGGVPAKLLKKRFENEIIDKLLTIDFKKLSLENITKNIDRLDDDINLSNFINYLKL